MKGGNGRTKLAIVFLCQQFLAIQRCAVWLHLRSTKGKEQCTCQERSADLSSVLDIQKKAIYHNVHENSEGLSSATNPKPVQDRKPEGYTCTVLRVIKVHCNIHV